MDTGASKLRPAQAAADTRTRELNETLSDQRKGLRDVSTLALTVNALATALADLLNASERAGYTVGPNNRDSPQHWTFQRKSRDQAGLLYGTAAIGAYLGITERQAKHRCRSEQIPSFKMGRTVCSTAADLDKYLARRIGLPS